MALSVFSGDAAKVTEGLKDHYIPQRIKEMVYKNQPLLALMPKHESFGGDNMPIPIITTGPQRRSATFVTGQSNTSTSSMKRFLLTRARDYSFASIEHEAIRASKGDADAFVRYATMEIDGAIHSLKRSLGVGMYRDGSGAIGTLTPDPSTGTTVTLAVTDDVSNFEVGMNIVFAANGTSALRAGGARTISAINRVTGVITVSAAMDAAVADNDSIFQSGDYVSSSDRLKISGLEAWCPESAPSATAFFGVDRTTDVTRLGGQRSDGSAKPIEEALIDGLSLCAREGGSPSHIFTDFTTYANLEKALGSKVIYDKVSASDADIGFTSLKINSPAGAVNVIADINCQPNVAWALQLDTWMLASLDSAPHILDLDGPNMLREAAADAYEVRVGCYANVACSAPGWNCRIKLA